MVTIGKFRRTARVTTVVGAAGAALVLAAGPAFAANGIDVTGVGPRNIKVNYSCESSAGVAAIEAMVGDPHANSPSATGRQDSPTCDGGQHSAVVVLTGSALSAGQQVQVRAALVDRNETVVSGTAKVFTLG